MIASRKSFRRTFSEDGTVRVTVTGVPEGRLRRIVREAEVLRFLLMASSSVGPLVPIQDANLESFECVF